MGKDEGGRGECDGYVVWDVWVSTANILSSRNVWKADETTADSILDEAGEIKAREILERLVALRGRVKEGLKEKVSEEIRPSHSRSKISLATSHRESSSLRANDSVSTQATVQAAASM